MNIVCTIDEPYAQHCGVMLRSLFTNNPGVTFRVFLLTDGLSASSREKLDAVAKESGQSIQYLPLDPLVLRDAPVSGHVSLATYFRILIPGILPLDVEKALFLDADIIVRGSIVELYEQALDSFPVAAVSNPLARLETERLGIPFDAGYFNAGVLLLNLRRWREEDLPRKLLSCIATHRDRLHWWDQDALNVTIQGRWHRCHPLWNAQEAHFGDYAPSVLGVTPEELIAVRSHPRIVHFTGSFKPWQYGSEHPFTGDYYRYLAQTPWKGFRPLGRPSALVRATLLAARVAPPAVRHGYRKLAAAFRPGVAAASPHD